MTVIHESYSMYDWKNFCIWKNHFSKCSYGRNGWKAKNKGLFQTFFSIIFVYYWSIQMINTFRMVTDSRIKHHEKDFDRMDENFKNHEIDDYNFSNSPTNTKKNTIQSLVVTNIQTQLLKYHRLWLRYSKNKLMRTFWRFFMTLIKTASSAYSN